MNKKNNKFLHGLVSRLSLTVLLLAVGAVYAMAGDNSVFIKNFSILPGQTKTVSVELENEDPISSLQFDIKLPDGLTLRTAGKNTEAGRVTKTSHSFVYDTTSEGYRIVLLSNQTNAANSAFTGNEGALVDVTIEADADFQGGKIMLYNIVGSNGTDSSTDPVEIIMNKREVKVDPLVGYLLADPASLEVKPGRTTKLGVSLENKVNLVALQADIILPAGLSIVTSNGLVEDVTDRLPENVTVKVNELGAVEGGVRYRLAVSSLTRDVFKGNSGVLFNLDLAVADDFAGEHEILFNNSVVSLATATEYNIYTNDKSDYLSVPVSLVPDLNFTLSPENGEPLASLSEITLTPDLDVTAIAEDAVVSVYRNGDKINEGTLSIVAGENGNVVKITLGAPIEEYGTYTVEIPAGVISAGLSTNEAATLIYQIGTLEATGFQPAMDEVLTSLKDITVFMSSRVGGFLDGAVLNVTRNGDKVGEATLDWGMEPNSNEVSISLAHEITEYGTYVIEVPAGVIFDDAYTGGEDAVFSGARANEAFTLTYNVGTLEPISIQPSQDEILTSLKDITLVMNSRVGGFLDGAVLAVTKNGDKVGEATLDWGVEANSNEVTISLAHEITEYGTYVIEIPAGVIFDDNYSGEDAAFSGARSNEAITLVYNVGTLEATGFQPAMDEVLTSLKDITVFMSSRVGGFLDGAVLNVTRNGDKVGEATLDWGMEPNSNEVSISLAHEITEYGTYVIEVPAGVIFDDAYTGGEDAAFSGARANEAFTLTYNVKTLQAAGTYPSMDEVQESLKDITVTMNARVGGVLEGNKLDVTRNGDKVAEATVAEGMEPNSNEVIISLDREISDYGTYVIEVPQGVIFDDNYNGEDAAFSGARSNDAFTLTYNVGTMQYASAYPSTETAVETLKEITVFMNTRVGGILDGAEFDVKKDGEVVTTAALAEGMEPNSNEVLLTLADEITEYGTYTIEIPGNVIFDDNYNGEDAVFSGARGNDAFALTYNVGVFEVASVTPEDGATLESLSEIKLKMTATVGGILDGATLTVKRNGEDAVPATLSVSEDDATEVVVTLGAEQAEYGLYTIEIPAGTIFDEKYDELDPMMSGARSNDLIALSYHVGEFNVVNVDPLPGTPLDSLTQVTVFMSAPVGGFLEGAAVDVMKNGDKVAEAVLDWATEIGGNDVAVILPHAVAEYGTYTIVVPAGVIFDVNYSGDDAAFSGAQGNEAFELTYKVGEFEVADIVPAPGDEPVESLKNIEIFMNARVGGFLDGAKVNVLKNGDVVAEGTLDWATEPYGNDVVVRLNTELTEYGTYTVEIPAGVIFDENYVAEDPAMSGASSNDVLTLVYQVGKFELVSTTPVQTEAQPSLKDIELFMSARVGGFDEGATVTVTRNGSEITTGTLDWATEPLGNDIVIRLADEITEFGVYEIVIPAGTIYDENYESYDEVDPFFSGAKSNEEIKLTYTIGLSLGDFVPVSITPSLNSTVESLSEIEIEMSSEVGGFLIGSPVVVTNEEGVEVARGSFEWAEDTNGAELVIRLDKVIEEAGTYEVSVPAGVIYDESYNENDPFMPGVKHNEAFTLTYTVSGASSIDGVKVNIDSNDKVYNLNGVRVNGPIGKGLYIINGKKVVNKK